MYNNIKIYVSVNVWLEMGLNLCFDLNACEVGWHWVAFGHTRPKGFGYFGLFVFFFPSRWEDEGDVVADQVGMDG